MNTDQEQLIEEGEVTPELASQLLYAAMNGDTASAENGSQPNTTQVTDNTPEDHGVTTQVNEEELTTENAVIVAKDGKHTIPYDKLVEARNGEKEWKQKFDEAQQQLAQLQAQAQTRIESGQTPTLQDNNANIAQQAIDQGVDPEIFGDFSEKALAEGIQKLVQSQVSNLVQQQLQTALAPMQQQQELTIEQAHYQEIFTAHPDAESIVESQEFNNWKASQPSFIQNAYDAVLNQGSAAQVVELLGLYKSSNQLTTPEPDAVKAAAEQAVKKAQMQVPNSLSDFPTGSPIGKSTDERLSNLSGPELLNQMQSWTPEQIDAFYARNG